MTVIDVHTHLAPDLSVTTGNPIEEVQIGSDGHLVVDGHRLGMPGLYSASQLADSINQHGIERAWVSAPPPLYRQGMDVGETDAWVHVLDAGMRTRLAGHRSLDLLTYVPLDHPRVAVRMVQNTTGNAGWVGSAGGGSQALDDPTMESLWETLEETGKPLLLHPGQSPDTRLATLYLANLLGNPVETGIAAAQLMLGGVLERHPGLNIILVHCGGIVPALVGRWARGVATERPGLPSGLVDPSTTVRRFWVDTLAHSPEVVDLACTVFGLDRLVLGSDYPFPMGIDDPYDSIAHLDAAARGTIARNAARLQGDLPT